MQHLHSFIQEPYNPVYNFNLALEYESLNQTAAASFYLRTAEKTNDESLQYQALIRNALCFEKQGNRDLTVKTLLQRAISLLPNRPEGYYFLSRLQEKRQEYHDGYMTASIGVNNFDGNLVKLNSLPEFSGLYTLLFEKAVCGWWVGLTEESREIIFDLNANYFSEMDDIHKSAVRNNINIIGFPKHKYIYTNSLQNELVYKFKNLEKIRNNFSQVYQDMFVLTLLDGKENGTYLELGSNDPFYNNNTALLETIFNWKGISIDIDSETVNNFKNSRNNLVICENALNINYEYLLKENKFPQLIDYLSLDCDPPEVSFQVLQNILNSNYKFKIITFEHDYYYNNEIRDKSREYLISQGYELLINDVAFNNTNSFEDWWVLRNYINSDAFKFLNSNINFVQSIFYKKLN